MPVTKLPAEYETNASGREKVLRRFEARRRRRIACGSEQFVRQQSHCEETELPHTPEVPPQHHHDAHQETAIEYSRPI